VHTTYLFFSVVTNRKLPRLPPILNNSLRTTQCAPLSLGCLHTESSSGLRTGLWPTAALTHAMLDY